MNIQKVYSDRVGHFVLEFDKENSLSLLFSNGSHTENNTNKALELALDYKKPFSGISWLDQPVKSTTLEMMPRGDKLIKICSEYEEYWDGSLLNYFPVEELMELLNKIKETK